MVGRVNLLVAESFKIKPGDEFRAGLAVYHAVFGEGVAVKRQGVGVVEFIGLKIIAFLSHFGREGPHRLGLLRQVSQGWNTAQQFAFGYHGWIGLGRVV